MSRALCEGPARLAERLAARRFAAVWLVLLGVVLVSPSIFTGLVADDLLHQLLLRQQPGIPGLSPKALDLFHFADGKSAVARQLMNQGVFPWWTDGELRLAFLRPLAGLTHFIDHGLWPNSPAMMHLQSLSWYALLLGIVAYAYGAWLPTRAAALLALLLFAVDDLHAPAVGWIANRSLTVSLVFSFLALILHHRALAAGRKGAWLAPAALALGLLAGEAALAGVAYLLAYALFLDQRPLRSRVLSLAPYVVVIVAWRVAYRMLGYGASGSGVYIDPGAAPLAFAEVALTRIPVLLLSTFALPWADFWDGYPLLMPSLRPLVLCLALAVGGVLVVLLGPLLRGSRSARFWAAGCLLSVVPSAATFPHDRLLLGTGIGAMALLSELFLHHAHAARRATQAAVAGFAIVHLGLAPVLLPYRSATVDHLSAVLWRADASLPESPTLAQQTWVIANPPLVPFGSYLPIYREAAGKPRPRRCFWLATGASEVRIARPDARTLRVRPSLGYLSDATQLMLRSAGRPLKPGETIELDDASFEVTSLTPDGRPAEVLVRFHRDLSDKGLVFLRWAGHGYVPLQLPAPGGSLVLPPVDLLAALAG